VFHSLSQRLVARYFAGLLVISGLVSAVVHPLPNLTDMTGGERSAITATCVIGGILVWFAPWQRWPRWSLLFLPVIGLAVKTWANLHGGLGPYSYSIHFVLIYVWMGVALPRGTPLGFAPLLALAYALPLFMKGDPKQIASVAMVVPICVLVGESVAWISNRLRRVEKVDGQHMSRMGWLVEASVKLAGQHERAELAERVARLGMSLPGASGAAVLLQTPGRALEVVGRANWPGRLPERFDLSAEAALVEAMRTGVTLGADDGRAAELGARLKVARVVVAPLMGSTRPAGVVLLARRISAAPFDDFTTNLARTLLVQAGLAFERVALSERLREASLQDELTGVGNRRKANARLERLSAGDALVMIDLDHFKQVNDTKGHAAGDEALRDLGGFLAGALRHGDEVFRLGGEEFLVVLQGARDGARIAADRLCTGWRLQEPLTTFSAGVAIHSEHRSAEATLEGADAALYVAKEAGRDQVAVEA